MCRIYSRNEVQEWSALLTSREADDPDVQELLVRQSLLELLPPVVGTARAAWVVHLLLPLPQQQRRSDAALLLLHCTYVLWWLLTEEERDQRRVASTGQRARKNTGYWRWLLVWRSAPKRFRHGLRRLEWLEPTDEWVQRRCGFYCHGSWMMRLWCVALVVPSANWVEYDRIRFKHCWDESKGVWIWQNWVEYWYNSLVTWGTGSTQFDKHDFTEFSFNLSCWTQ